MSKTHTEKWRNWLTEEMTKLGLKVTPSVDNRADPFPARNGKTAATPTFLTKRDSCCAVTIRCRTLADDDRHRRANRWSMACVTSWLK